MNQPPMSQPPISQPPMSQAPAPAPNSITNPFQWIRNRFSSSTTPNNQIEHGTLQVIYPQPLVIQEDHIYPANIYQSQMVPEPSIRLLDPRLIQPSKYYSLLMIDLHAPAGIFIHWWKINLQIQFDGSIQGLYDSNTTYYSYYPPSPPIQYPHLHTYVVLLFEQLDGKMTIPSNKNGSKIFETREKLMDKLKGMKCQYVVGGFTYFHVDPKEQPNQNSQKQKKNVQNMLKKIM